MSLILDRVINVHKVIQGIFRKIIYAPKSVYLPTLLLDY